MQSSDSLNLTLDPPSKQLRNLACQPRPGFPAGGTPALPGCDGVVVVVVVAAVAAVAAVLLPL